MRGSAALLLVGVVLIVVTPDSSAQLFGTKKPKVPPQQRVPELIVILRQDKDAHKRTDAAEELRQFEPKDFPDIVPALIDALQSDAATNVRLEAATSLGRLRPIPAPAGVALEKAAANDASLRVRVQAKASLVYYQISGYHVPKQGDVPAPGLKGSTAEPPLAAGGGEQWWNNGKTQPATPPGMPATNAFRPLPSGPASKDVPIVTAPAQTPEPPKGPPISIMPPQGPAIQTPPPQGPAIQTPPPPLKAPPMWTPIETPPQSGPSLGPKI